jgi:hypothetical protein
MNFYSPLGLINLFAMLQTIEVSSFSILTKMQCSGIICLRLRNTNYLFYKKGRTEKLKLT